MSAENGLSGMSYSLLAAILVALILSHYVRNNDIGSDSNGHHKYQHKKDVQVLLHPNYEEYILHASLNNWNPVNPIDKFMDVIGSFEMDVEYVFHNVSKSKREEHHTVINMKHHEMLYLAEVLKRPINNDCGRKINVMPLLFKSVEVLNRVIFRVMKDVLRLGISRVVTRQRAGKIAANAMYRPVKTVLSLIVEIISAPHKYSHLKADPNERLIIKNGLRLNVLDLAVQYQFSPLIPLFLNMNISKKNSIKLAIENGDDVIMKQLLDNKEENSADFIEMAKKLGYYRMVSRLENRMKEDPINEFLPSTFKKHDCGSANTSGSLFGSVDYRDDNGGYSKVFLKIHRHNERICGIDRINFREIVSDPSIFDSYSRLNKPLMISLEESGLFFKLRNLFSLKRVVLNSERRINASFIPYGNHYGYERREMILREFIMNIMTPYTEMIATSFAADDSDEVNLNLSDLVQNALFQGLELPRYVFDTTEIVSTGEIQEVLEDLAVNDTFHHLLNSLGNSLNTRVIWQQYMGPIFSGAPFHSHGPALNLLIFGSKKWGLLPPANGIFSSIPPLEVLKIEHKGGVADVEDKVSAGICYVNQYAGEMLFVPRHFSHQVINLADSVGLAIEGNTIYHPS